MTLKRLVISGIVLLGVCLIQTATDRSVRAEDGYGTITGKFGAKSGEPNIALLIEFDD